MKFGRRKLTILLLLIGGGLGGCATNLEDIITSPSVELRDVKVMGLGFSSQTFLLSFDVSNPNSFALPVKDVSYGIRLDGQRFASGSTPSSFSVPAGGQAQFAISVELDLLQTAPRLLSIVRRGESEYIRYDLEGQLAVDIPFAPPVSYKTSGQIQLGAGGF